MSTELGTLVVVVLKARNLPDKHSFYKQDVFAQVTLQGETKKTQIEIKGGQHPVWDEELRFPVYDKGKSGMMMEVSCWSKEPRSNDLVGKGELDISETLRTGEFDDWIPLSIETTQRGDLYLEMTFFAAGPPPALTRRPSKMKPTERLSRPQQVSPPRVANSHSQHSSISPRPAQGKPLPPLAEEPPALSQSPPPEDIPLFLRPGAGKGRSPNHRPTGSLSTSDYPPAQSPPIHSHRPSTSISSLSSNAGALPAALRAGHGGSPTPVPQGTFVPDAQIPRLPSETLGGAPAPSPAPASVHNAYNYSSPQPYPPTTYSSPPPIDRPIPALPPITQTSIDHTHTPQPTWQAPQAAQPPPVQRYSPPQPSYSQLAPAQPPPQPYQQYNSTQPQYAPPLQPSTQPAPVTLPGFAFPTPTVTPAPPPPASSAPQNSGYGYPYAPYGPQASYTSPYGAPHPQAYGPSHQNAQRPYPYNYPPPPRDPDLDVPPLNSERYQKPLPLPDEPASGATPTPAHPRGRVDSSAHHRSSSGHHHTSSTSSAVVSSHQKKPSREERKPEISREERDRQVAAQYEKDEAERRRIAREQEEKDAELARQLDLELNLQEESAAINGTGERAGSPNNGNNNGMPGSWYRVRT